MRRLRVLVVSPTFPYPPSFGFGTRVYQLTKNLSARHDVTLLTYARQDELVYVDTLREEIGAIRVVAKPQLHGLMKRLSQVASIVLRESYVVRELQTAAMQRAIDEFLLGEKFDVIQLESVQLFGLRYDTRIPIVLDEHNIEYELLERMQQGERSWTRRAYSRAECRKLRPMEREAWGSVDGCAVTSEREAAIVDASATSTAVRVVPNGVDPDFFAPTSVESEPDTLVFNGLLSYRPNFDAVRYFVEDILPRLLKVRPKVQVTIVGEGTPSELRSLRHPSVVLTGKVPDVRPYLEQSAVVVVPIRIGGGTRLKVIEALAMARPVVSTAIGCEGLRVVDGEHLLIADDADTYVAKIALLLSDSPRAGALGRAGRELMVSEYSWERSAEHLETLYNQLGRRIGRAAIADPEVTAVEPSPS